MRQNAPLHLQMFIFVRIYDENKYTREGKNGRIYEGTVGWRWHFFPCQEPVGDLRGYKTKREAIAAAELHLLVS